MKEVEILVEVKSDIKVVKEKLEKFEFLCEDKIKDIYYYDPLRNNLKPDNGHIKECLRLRTKANEYFITYKNDNFDSNGKWLYSDEFETKIIDKTVIEKILKNLGLKELIVIDSIKKYINLINMK